MLLLILAIGLLALCLPGTLELLLVTSGDLLWPLRRRRRNPAPERPGFRLTVIVPAHNEESCVENTVRHLISQGCDSLVVVADNCSDQTAARARGAGAEVWVRENLSERGKAAALRFAFEEAEQLGNVDGVLVLDADSRISASLIRDVRSSLASGADAVQCRNVVANASESPRTALLALALTAFNGVRPRGRAMWGLSAGPLANGFAVSMRTLRRVPFAVTSIVEDLEYHLLLTQAGCRVEFLNGAVIQSDMPSAGSQAATQRARWEGGRFGVVRRWVPRLIHQPARTTIEPLLELLTMPLGLHAMVLAAAAVLATHPACPYGIVAAVWFAIAVLAAHVAAAVLAMEQPAAASRALLFAPVYVLWKTTVALRTLRSSKADALWAERSASR
jgi:cellulose synthase/poly-beta-1,6-N-acetylglucosamine synthase-like glycosyltransferase